MRERLVCLLYAIAIVAMAYLLTFTLFALGAATEVEPDRGAHVSLMTDSGPVEIVCSDGRRYVRPLPDDCDLDHLALPSASAWAGIVDDATLLCGR